MSQRTPSGNVNSGRGAGQRVDAATATTIRLRIKEGVLSYAEIALATRVTKRTVQRYADRLRQLEEKRES